MNSIDVTQRLHHDLGLPARAIAATLALLAEGATVPFIARYRKEQTGSLDEVQIRAIQERHAYVAELEDRRAAVLKSIGEQGKLDDALAARITACATKAELEDLYLPFKPKRRTRAMIARERGLEPLALRILEQPTVADPNAEASAFVSAERDVASSEAALSGARDIVAERIAEDAEVRAWARTLLSERGEVVSKADPAKTRVPTKFEQYYEHREPIATIPSHRYLAIRRGEREEILRLALEVDAAPLLGRIGEHLGHNPKSPFGPQLALAVTDAYERLVFPSIETDLRVELKLRADRDAVQVFAENLRNLLLSAPLGQAAVIGIDPGIRTGCKCAAVTSTGKFEDTITIFPQRDAGAAAAELIAFVRKHQPGAIAVGNGTAGRETESLVRRALVAARLDEVIVVSVSESGASVYSASDIAREEFPELDLTIRGAISIARRLQDPLAELVKVDPKAIGVGQYQHDVHQPLLARKLDEVVESCVNGVGVELNTASAPLLSRVAGIGPGLAKKIVDHREREGAFAARRQLLEVPGLGPRTFEQAAGFLRVRNGRHPLDASAVHPERYALVEEIARDLGVALEQLVGSASLARSIDTKRYLSQGVGEATLADIVAELAKPGRDPRANFDPPKFDDAIHDITQLEAGMALEGVVTNVTNFGAFVDIGVHQDGLVHISQLADRFVKDPHEVVKAGDRLRVRVLEVDVERRRISLTAKSGTPTPKQPRDDSQPAPRGDSRSGGPNRLDARAPSGRTQPATTRFSNNPFAALKRD